MVSPSNADRFAAAVTAMQQGDIGPFITEFSEDMVLHVPPALPWSPGELRGPKALAELLSTMLQWSEGHYENEVVHVGGEGDLVVTVNVVRAVHRRRSHDYQTAWTYRFADGVIVEAWLISSMSSDQLADFWARPAPAMATTD